MLILFLAVFVLTACASSGPLAGILAAFAAVTLYCLVALVHMHHRCPSCRGRRVKVRGKRARTCRLCKGRGRTRRFAAPAIHRLAWTIAGPSLKARLELRHEELREKAGYPE